MSKKQSRFALLYTIFLIFITINTVIRTILLVKSFPQVDISLPVLAEVYGVGFFYDCVTYFYFIIPVAAYVILAPDKVFKSLPGKMFVYLTLFVITYALLFDIAAEYFFFDEFATRFNFIAVDYLVYTTEVVRNIQQSYPVGWILAGVFIISVVGVASLRLDVWSRSRYRTSLSGRMTQGMAFVFVPVLSFFFVTQDLGDISKNNYVNELSANGIYDLFAAFRNNELDYGKFYSQLDEKKLLPEVRQLLKEDDSEFVSAKPDELAREVTAPGPAKKLNVVVIVEESLSAEYMKHFGNTQGITPVLDKLADESLFFTHMYAAGTRTVRGLEAITLSVPPLPGTSVIKRPGNENLFSWGSLMDSMGYESKFLYGGYGYFDNMNYFYSKNGFSIVDRKDMSKAETTFSNAWGVCDEDLFNKVISEGDKSAKAGKPFFYVVMTTSNHRPYTYPAGRIDIKSGTREGAVKYSDYAIGRLIAGAEKKPWAKDTVFVIIADHCAGSARRVALPVKKYEIPMLAYSPGHIKPAVFDRMISQIDVAPTVLDLLGMSYKTRFMGYDIFKTKPGDERAFISTYQKMGFIKGDRLVILDPGRKVENYTFRRGDGSVKQAADDGRTADEALAWYQGRNYFYKHGQDRF